MFPTTTKISKTISMMKNNSSYSALMSAINLNDQTPTLSDDVSDQCNDAVKLTMKFSVQSSIEEIDVISHHSLLSIVNDLSS